MTLTDEARARLRAITDELPKAVYPNPDWDRVHALEDEGATILGRQTVRQATEVISGRDLYRLMLDESRKPTVEEIATRLASNEAAAAEGRKAIARHGSARAALRHALAFGSSSDVFAVRAAIGDGLQPDAPAA